MIITDQFAFIHLHKSGGTFVNKVICELFGSARIIGYHYPLKLLPKKYQHLPILGVVRNPWDFYVSYYTFQKYLINQFNAKYEKLSSTEYNLLIEKGIDPRNGIDILFDFVSQEGTLNFAETTENILKLGTTDSQLDKLLDIMPVELEHRGKLTPIQKEGFRGMNVTRNDLEEIRGTNEGLYTFLFKRMYGDGEVIYFAHMETLRQDLINFLENIGIKMTKPMEEYILKAQSENISQHRFYSKYYSEELKDLVQQQDSFVIKKFLFNFSYQ
jgi:hypothetical protein